jgi:hypothetical protein
MLRRLTASRRRRRVRILQGRTSTATAAGAVAATIVSVVGVDGWLLLLVHSFDVRSLGPCGRV